MPCDCSHMEPTYDEAESTRVCKHICYLFKMLGKSVPEWIEEGSDENYGIPSRVTEVQNILYQTIKSLSKKQFDEYVYNPKSRQSRRLADWYEDFDRDFKQEIKYKKKIEEQEKRAKSILAKLRADDVKIIKEYLEKTSI